MNPEINPVNSNLNHLSPPLEISTAKSIKHISRKGKSKLRLILSNNHKALRVSAVATDTLSSSIFKPIYAYFYIELKGTNISIKINSMAKRLGLSKAEVIQIAQTDGGLQQFIEIAEKRALALSCYGKIAKNYILWFGMLQARKDYCCCYKTHLTPDQLIKTITLGLSIAGKEHSQTKQVFSSADLKKIHLALELKGSGSFSNVYKTINLSKSISHNAIKHSAIKIFEDADDIYEAHERNVLLELNPFGEVEGLPRPPSQVTLLANMKNFISLELFSSDLTAKHLTEFYDLPIKEKLKLCAQLTNALHYMHKNKWYHGDIKPANCLMKVDPQTKKPIKFVLSDFDGTRKNKIPALTNEAYSPYASPSQPESEERKYGGQDVFGLSKTIIEILIAEKIEKIDVGLPKTKEKLIAHMVPEDVIDILMKSDKEVNERPTANELHAVFMAINS